jgi:hypothetical protein
VSLLAPAALGLASLAVPIVVLYMLRSRRRRVEVSSTLLWGRMDETVTSAVPWKRLPLTPLLLLQLAVLAAFVLTLARPFFTQATLLGPHTVLIVDTSGSMSLAGRLERARQRAVELAADVSPANLVSVLEAGPAARVAAAFAQTREAVEAAVASLRPTGGPADLSGAIKLARGLATPDRPTNLVLLTDGGEAPLPEEPVLAAVQIPFDETADNVAISAFTAEPTIEGAVRVFVTVANHTTTRRDAELRLLVDDLPAGDLTVSIDPLDEVSRTIPVDAGPGDVLTIRRLGEPDGLALDDQAWLVLGGGPDRTVALLGEGSPFLEALVEIAPGFSPAAGAERADILIVDRGDLPEIDRPAWVIRTTRPPEGLTMDELVENAVATYQRPGEPILDAVDLSELAVAEAQVVETITWLPLVRAGDVPLILLGEVNGHRVVYFTFDITHSNLPVQVGFPILGARLLDWLGGSSAGAVSSGVAGEPIPLTPPSGAAVEVTTPDGEVRALSETAAVFRETGTPGVYRVRYLPEGGEPLEGPVAVRSFLSTESGALPRTVATVAGDTGADGSGSLVREWGPWVAAIALALMAVEWWVGHQRPAWRRREVAA